MHRAEFVVKHRGGHANGIFSGKPGGTTRRLAPDVHSTRFESARAEKGVGEPESAPALHATHNGYCEKTAGPKGHGKELTAILEGQRADRPRVLSRPPREGVRARKGRKVK